MRSDLPLPVCLVPLLLSILLFSHSCRAQEPLAARLQRKAEDVKKKIPEWVKAGGRPETIRALGRRVEALMKARKVKRAERVLDRMLAILKSRGADRPAGRRPAPRFPYKELRVSGEIPRNGIYDPSIEYGPGKIGWMSYSSVVMGAKGRVHTHIARTDDRGKTWKFVTAVNKSVAGVVRTPEGQIVKGAWWNEVSTLVYDPGEKGRKKWKLFWHKYFTRIPHKNGQDRMLSHGWIAYRHASSPKGPWSKEIPLLGVGPFPVKPFKTRVNVARLHPDLKDCIVLTEPGSLAKGGKLYLSLQAIRPAKAGPPVHAIILLASPDHGKSWKYINTLLRPGDAKVFGGGHFTGSSLAVEKGRVFLLVCPEDPGKPLTGHRGTVIFEFEDIAQGKLKRNREGKLAAVKFLKPRLAKGGQSDYDEKNTGGGIVMPQFDLANLPRAFRIFNTKQGILENPSR